MKRRIAVGFLVVVALFFAYREGKGKVVDWYADNYIVRPTPYPGTVNPDQLCLTWSEDPRTTQSVQWRTATSVPDGWVEYRESAAGEDAVQRVQATRASLQDRLVENDPVNHRFTATLTDLRPATTYSYRVGSDQKQTWSDWREFTTAPDGTVPFQFVYMGDVQKGFSFWDPILSAAFDKYPNAAFCLIAGDLVNSGSYRNEWDEFYKAGEAVFSRKPLVPTLGNHDYDKKEPPQLYLSTLALPDEGPKKPGPERAYAFRYSNAFFVVLDSNKSIEEQTPWLEEQLKSSDATWKIAMYHHPAYASVDHRRNDELRDSWMPLFDKYDVDLALQGHDHAYLRTYPMHADKRAEQGSDGVVYTVTVAGNKYYEQGEFDYAAKAFANVSTYQIIDITTNPDRLSYQAYDDKGALRDEFTLEK